MLANPHTCTGTVCKSHLCACGDRVHYVELNRVLLHFKWGVINASLSALELFIEPWLSGNPLFFFFTGVYMCFLRVGGGGDWPNNTRRVTVMNEAFARTDPLASHHRGPRRRTEGGGFFSCFLQ